MLETVEKIPLTSRTSLRHVPAQIGRFCAKGIASAEMPLPWNAYSQSTLVRRMTWLFRRHFRRYILTTVVMYYSDHVNRRSETYMVFMTSFSVVPSEIYRCYTGIEEALWRFRNVTQRPRRNICLPKAGATRTMSMCTAWILFRRYGSHKAQTSMSFWRHLRGERWPTMHKRSPQ